MNEFLIELGYRSLVLAALGLTIRFALLRSSAHARASVLTVTMGALAILPIAMIVLPRLSVTVAQKQIVEPASVVLVANPPPTPFPWIIVWATIASVFLARVVISLVRFRSLQSGFSPASASLTQRVKGFSMRARGVFFGPEGEPPMTWGFLQPKIALPVESEEWVEPQLRSVVLHEDAHIRRRDWVVTIGFRVIAAMYWANPLVWAMQYLFEQDCERAADDSVLAQGLDAPEYAGRLVEVAKTLRRRKSRIPAVTMARSARLNGRVAAILSAKTRRGVLKGWTRASVLGLLASGAVAAGIVVPEVKQIRISKEAPRVAIKTGANIDLQDKTEPRMTVKADDNEPIDVSASSVHSQVSLGKQSKVPLTPPHPAKGRSAAVASNQKDGMNIAVSGLEDMKIDGLGDVDWKAMQKEIAEGLKQAKSDIDKATKDSEKDIRDAEAEIDKTEMPEFARKMAKQSLAMAKSVTNNLIKGKKASLTEKEKAQKASPKPPKDQDDPDES